MTSTQERTPEGSTTRERGSQGLGSGVPEPRTTPLTWFAVSLLVLASSVGAGVRRRWDRAVSAGEAGMATAEYAIVTLAAVAFAGLLLAILRGGEVREMLLGLIREARSR